MLEWAGATFVKLTKIRAWQELVFVLAVISKIESREKALKFSYSDGLMTIYEQIGFAECIFWHNFYAIDILCFIDQSITLLSALLFCVFCN